MKSGSSSDGAFLNFTCRVEKVQVGKDQEKAQSENDSYSKKPRSGKTQTNNQVLIPCKHIVSRMSSYFPNRWSLSYLILTKNMKAYIRRKNLTLLTNKILKSKQVSELIQIY